MCLYVLSTTNWIVRLSMLDGWTNAMVDEVRALFATRNSESFDEEGRRFFPIGWMLSVTPSDLDLGGNVIGAWILCTSMTQQYSSTGTTQFTPVHKRDWENWQLTRNRKSLHCHDWYSTRYQVLGLQTTRRMYYQSTSTPVLPCMARLRAQFVLVLEYKILQIQCTV